MLSPPSPSQLADIDPVYYFYVPPIRQFEVEPLPLRVNLAKLSENSHYKLDVHIWASGCDVDVTTKFRIDLSISLLEISNKRTHTGPSLWCFPQSSVPRPTPSHSSPCNQVPLELYTSVDPILFLFSAIIFVKLPHRIFQPVGFGLFPILLESQATYFCVLNTSFAYCSCTTSQNRTALPTVFVLRKIKC